MLVVRIALKIRYRDLFRACLNPSYGFIPRSFRAELDWLLERVHVQDIHEHLSASGLPVSDGLLAGFLERYAAERLTPAYFLGFKVKLTRSLKSFRIRSLVGVQTRRAAFFVKRIVFRAQTKKTLRGTGVFFALVGADGSGKTRLAEDLRSWLNWKLEARVLYFGIPKTAFLYQCLIRANDTMERVQKKAQCLGVRLPGKMLGIASDGIASLLWLYIGYRRWALARQAESARKKGCITIGERFPLPHFMGMPEPMDGPRLQKNSKGGFAPRLERFFYAGIALPDHLFVLKAGAEVLHARKNITPRDALRRKVDAVNRITSDVKTTVIDAEAPYESVLRTIQNAVWDML